MQSDTRIPTLRLSVRQLFKEARALNPQNHFSLYTFSSPVWENLNTEPEMESALSNLTFSTGLDAPKPLKYFVLNPLLQKARQKALKPTVAVTITDGDVRIISESLFRPFPKSRMLIHLCLPGW